MDHGMRRKGEDALFGKPNCEDAHSTNWWEDDFLIVSSMCNALNNVSTSGFGVRQGRTC